VGSQSEAFELISKKTANQRVGGAKASVLSMMAWTCCLSTGVLHSFSMSRNRSLLCLTRNL
jgi:hypothetical protein